MHILTDLFLSFIKIGLFTFGGGYAMISLIENICVEVKHWITHDDMMNITIIAESTPGPIAINCATFVGYKRKGLLGAIAATIGVILPSFIIIYAIAAILDNFLELAIVASAFKGIKLAVSILILDASFKMIKKLKKDILTLAILIAAAAIMLALAFFSLHFSTIYLMLVAGSISMLVISIKGRLRKAGNKQ